MRDRYNLEKKEFYKKAIPIIAALVFILAVTLEVIYRIVGYGQITIITSVINWICFALFFGLAFGVRRFVWTSWIVCPVLTLFTYYYFTFVDF
jgi:hypothetical protein